MAKNPRNPNQPTKKHLARVERERRQTRLLLIGSAVVLVLVVLTIGFGVLNEQILRPMQPVAVVNGDNISTGKFQDQVRFDRYNLIQSAYQTVQFMQLFGSDPTTMSSFTGQLQQVQFQLAQPEVVGQTTLDRLVEDELIRQEAERRDITITEAELEKRFQEIFGYYAEGTPTPEPTLEIIPTSTLAPFQETSIAPTPTPVITATATTSATEAVTPEATAETTQAVTETPAAEASPSPAGEGTPTPTLAPTATPTPYTLEGYQNLYRERIDEIVAQFNVSEDALRYVIESDLYREKVKEAVLAEMEISRYQDQVWARVIQAEDEAAAQAVVERVNAGENWCTVAADASFAASADLCGDLDWQSREQLETQLDPAVVEQAFAIEPNTISEPIETQLGWYVVQVLGHEERPLDANAYEELKDTRFQEWLDQQREGATIDIKEYALERAPAEPTLPAEIDQIIQQNLQAPELTQPTPVAP